MRTVFLVLAFFAGLAVKGQDPLAEIREMDTLYYRDDLEGAKKLADKVYPRIASIKNDTVIVEFLNTAGSIYYNLQEYAKAIGFFNEAAEKAKSSLGENEYHYALAIFNKAGCLKELGRYTEAEPLYLKSLPTLAEAFGQNSLEYTRCFYTLASLYLESSRLTEAESMVAAAVNYYKVNPGQTSDDYLGALGTMGVIYQNQSRYDKAEEIFLSLKKYYSSLANPPAATMQVLENNLGELYRHMGDYAKAEPYLLKAVSMAGNGLAAAYSLNNLGLVQKALGQYTEAESSYKNAITIYRSLNKTEHPDYTNPVNGLGELYRTTGRYQDAVYAFEEIIDLRKKTLGTNHPNYANAVNNLALVEYTLGMYDAAEKHLLECKEIYKNILGEKDRFYANIINNLATLYKATGKLNQAEEMYKECLRIYKAGYGDSTDKYAIYLGGLAGTYRVMKKYDEAIDLTLKSLAILKERLGVQHYDYIETQYNLAETYRQAGKFTEAEKHYMESMDGYLLLIEKYFPYLSEKDKTSFYYNLSSSFETFTSFVIQLRGLAPGRDHSILISRIYDNQVALKSLLLKESGKIRSAISKSSSNAIKSDYNQWLQLRETIVRRYRGSADEEDTGSEPTVLLEKRANELEQKIAAALHIRPEKQTRLSWKNIQAALKPGEFAIEMIRTDYFGESGWTDTVYYSALVIEAGNNSPQFILMKGNDLEEKNITGYRKALKARANDEFSYMAFWEPLKKYITGAKKIYFSPDGVYQQVNLYTLKNPQTKKYLLDETEISLVTNTRDILQPANTGNKKYAVLFSYPDYGNSKQAGIDSTRIPGFPDLKELPGTLVESDSIRNLLQKNNWKVTGYIQKSATEQAVKSTAGPGILHIATHGFFLKDVRENSGKTLGMDASVLRQNPLLRSGVIMAGASEYAGNAGAEQGGEDGILTAYEAAGLDLTGTELVVLSACETGLGEILNGQGVYGLQRSFLVAGANAVLMSLWKIDDRATQQLMVAFYKEWLKDPASGKQKALRNAQVKLSQSYPEPYFWGAFILVGD